MATKQFGANKDYRVEQVTEATGAAAGTLDVDVNIKANITQLQAINALDQIKKKIIQSKVFP